jgi:hypothetical protein
MSELSKGSVILSPGQAECRSALRANNIYADVTTKHGFSSEGFLWADDQPATGALSGHPPKSLTAGN